MNKYEKYAKLKAAAKAVADEIKLLEEDIFADLEEKGVDQYKNDLGTFSITYRKTWDYPDEIYHMEEELKLRKKQLQQKLIAKPYTNPYVRFLPLKDKEV